MKGKRRFTLPLDLMLVKVKVGFRLRICRLYRKPYIPESTVFGRISKRTIMVDDFSFDLYQVSPQTGIYRQISLEIVCHSLINH